MIGFWKVKIAVRRFKIRSRNEEEKLKAWLKSLGHRIWMRSFLRDAMDQEIFSSCIMLKNLAVIRKQAPMSTDFMLEQLQENSFFLKRTYGNMLRMYRTGDRYAAFRCLEEDVGSRHAELFGGILEKTEQINPSELVTQMGAFQEMFEEGRMTRALRRKRVEALVCTAAGVAAVLSVLLNFTAIAIFLNMGQMLRSVCLV